MLTLSDKKILSCWNIPQEDFNQISEATGRKTKLFLQDTTKSEKNVALISHKEARNLLGQEKYLSGIVRSAFHWTSVRETEDNRYCVFFDSSSLFKD